jgi:MFS family permease
MEPRTRALLALLVFNGVSAAVGGLALMTEWIPEQASWVRDTDFASNYFPGVILMAVVGGSSLVAAAALVKRSDGWRLASIVAGTVMVFWIVGEIASIRAFHVLQLIYLVTGALVVAWTPRQHDAASREARAVSERRLTP